jgi:ribosomal protein S18 acetylase RimI-like enzyme
MSKIKIIQDSNFDYSQKIKQSLTAYNIKQSGIKEKDVRHFYVFDDDKLVGACYTKQNSDWCHIKAIYYLNMDVLKSLMNQVKAYYEHKTVGVKFDSIIKNQVNDFLSIGFIRKGKLADEEEGVEISFLVDKSFDTFSVDDDYESKSSKKPIHQYDKILKKKTRKIRENLEFSTSRNNVQFVALDNQRFIGGIFGNFQYEYLYINRLFVDPNYRGKRLATKLIRMIEKEAIKRGITNVYLTTFEFQALPLYKKKGFKVVMEINDYPKGFKEYTLYKKLKK